MTPSLYQRATIQLIRHEDKRRFPYLDTAKPPRITIGIGRNLTDRGLSDKEIAVLFDNDLNVAEQDAKFALGDAIYNGLSENRQLAILDMSFNLGRARLLMFTHMLQAIRDGDYALAAQGMRNSLWARQVGERARMLALLMEQG